VLYLPIFLLFCYMPAALRPPQVTQIVMRFGGFGCYVFFQSVTEIANAMNKKGFKKIRVASMLLFKYLARKLL